MSIDPVDFFQVPLSVQLCKDQIWTDECQTAHEWAEDANLVLSMFMANLRELDDKSDRMSEISRLAFHASQAIQKLSEACCPEAAGQ